MHARHAFLLAAAITTAACGDRPTRSMTGSTGGASGAGGATSTTSTSTGPCVEAWRCTPWETDGTSDAATRACADESQCGTTKSKPLESATLPGLDRAYFECEVAPILDRKCSMLGCHGTEQGRALRIYARGRKRLAGQLLSNPSCGAGATPSENCDGSTGCLCAGPRTEAERRRNYDAARGFALDSLGKPMLAIKADKCELLAQPVAGGEPHAGIHLFDKNDAEYATIKSWVTGAKLGAPCGAGSD